MADCREPRRRASGELEAQRVRCADRAWGQAARRSRELERSKALHLLQVFAAVRVLMNVLRRLLLMTLKKRPTSNSGSPGGPSANRSRLRRQEHTNSAGVASRNVRMTASIAQFSTLTACTIQDSRGTSNGGRPNPGNQGDPLSLDNLAESPVVRIAGHFPTQRTRCEAIRM